MSHPVARLPLRCAAVAPPPPCAPPRSSPSASRCTRAAAGRASTPRRGERPRLRRRRRAPARRPSPALAAARDRTRRRRARGGPRRRCCCAAASSRPGPTTDRCVSVDGVDWVIDESDAPQLPASRPTAARPPSRCSSTTTWSSGTTAITELSAAVSVDPRRAAAARSRSATRRLGDARDAGAGEPSADAASDRVSDAPPDELVDELGVADARLQPARREHRDRREARASC